MDRRIWIVAALVIAAAFMARELFQSRGPGTGVAAPAFTGKTLDGRAISLADFRGRSAVLLNFYSST